MVLTRQSLDEYFVMIHLNARTGNELLEGCTRTLGVQREQVAKVVWGDVLVQDDEDVALLEEKAKLMVHMVPEQEQRQLNDST